MIMGNNWIKYMLKTLLTTMGVIGYLILRFFVIFEDGAAYFFQNPIAHLILGVGIVVIYSAFRYENINYIKFNIKENIIIYILSFIFVVDARFQLKDNLDYEFIEWAFILIITICVSQIIMLVVAFICSVDWDTSIEVKSSCIFGKLFVLILLCWSPHILIFYPGATSWDGAYQLNQFEGIVTLSNKNPVIVTIIMGSLVKIGSFITPEFGLFLYNIIQTLFLVFVFCYGLNLLLKYRVSKKIFICTLLLILFFPIPLYFNYVLLKDGFFSSFLMLFTFLILRVAIEGGDVWEDKKYVLLYTVSVIGVLFFRKNGIYIVLITSMIWLITKRIWKKMLIITLCCISLYKTTDYIIEDVLLIEKGSSAEILSLPLQQLTRVYVKDCNAYTENELRQLEVTFDVVAASEVYLEYLSDPVKKSFHDASKKELISFFKIWVKKLFEYPVVYMEAFLGNANSYVDPTGILISERGFFFINRMCDDDAYTFVFKVQSLENLRIRLQNTLGQGEKIPFWGILFCPGFYFWLLIFVQCIFYRKKLWMVSLVPLYVTFLICLVSPVNGAVRYCLPIIEVMPFFLAVCTKKEKQLEITV